MCFEFASRTLVDVGWITFHCSGSSVDALMMRVGCPISVIGSYLSVCGLEFAATHVSSGFSDILDVGDESDVAQGIGLVIIESVYGWSESMFIS